MKFGIIENMTVCMKNYIDHLKIHKRKEAVSI